MADKIKSQEQYIASLEAELANAGRPGSSLAESEALIQQHRMSTLKTSQASVASYALQHERGESLEMQLLRGQYEREKKLLDQKVRQLAELESAAKDAQTLGKENAELKKTNEELNRIVREVKQQNDQTQKNLEQQ